MKRNTVYRKNFRNSLMDTSHVWNHILHFFTAGKVSWMFVFSCLISAFAVPSVFFSKLIYLLDCEMKRWESHNPVFKFCWLQGWLKRIFFKNNKVNWYQTVRFLMQISQTSTDWPFELSFKKLSLLLIWVDISLRLIDFTSLKSCIEEVL